MKKVWLMIIASLFLAAYGNLRKSSNGSTDGGTKWDYAKTASDNGTTIQAKLPNNQTKSVKPGEFILLN